MLCPCYILRLLLLYLSDWLLKGKNHPWDEFIVTCHVNKLCLGRKHYIYEVNQRIKFLQNLKFKSKYDCGKICPCKNLLLLTSVFSTESSSSIGSSGGLFKKSHSRTASSKMWIAILPFSCYAFLSWLPVVERICVYKMASSSWKFCQF